MKSDLADDVERALGRRPREVRRLSGGCVGDVRLLIMPDGERLVAKIGAPATPSLSIEAAMLRHLAERAALPAPRVVFASESLLIMEFIDAADPVDASAERHAAELLAALHAHTADAFGFEFDTLIGALPQPNPPTRSWIDFFRDHRLLHMSTLAASAGRIDAPLERRVHALGARLGEHIGEPPAPSLIHGDVWSGNVLARSGRVAAFLDPALSFSHPEIELAFITLFNTFGAPFFERYAELRPIAPGFFERRRDVYNLYPLLVHARLFGAGYANAVDASLRRLGFT